MTNTNQFIRHFTSLENQGLNPTAVSIMSHIYDRMQSSVKRPAKYFDQEQKAFFVIYTAPQMANEINVSVKTVRRYFEDLKSLGYLNLINTDDCTTYHIFTPQLMQAIPAFSFTLGGKKFSGDWSKCLLNHTYLVTTSFKDSKTVNTEHINTVKGSTPRAPMKETQAPKPAFSEMSAIERWKQATVANMHLSQNAVDVIAAFTQNNVAQSRQIVHHISTTRSTIAKKYKIEKTLVTQFESNQNIQATLGTKLKVIFSYINQHGFNKYAGFLIKSLKAYFLDAFGIKADVPQVRTQAKKKGHINENLPEWAKDDYQAKPVRQLTDAEKAKLEAELARLHQCTPEPQTA